MINVFPSTHFMTKMEEIEPISFYGCSNAYSDTSPENGYKNTPSKIELDKRSKIIFKKLTDYNYSTDDTTEELSSENDWVERKFKKRSQECKTCGKVLSSAASYYVHMKSHSDNKPFQCQVCDAAFCRKPYLEVHLRSHTGERPFECMVCKKKFSQKSSLNTHKRAHTGEKPFECEMCKKRFAVRSYLVSHQWTHISNKLLTCLKCDLNFTSKNQLMLHIKQHRTNFLCTQCMRSFTKDSYLKRHIVKMHTCSTTVTQPQTTVND